MFLLFLKKLNNTASKKRSCLKEKKNRIREMITLSLSSKETKKALTKELASWPL